MEIKIRDLSVEGLGIGATEEGKIYFVPDALIGETITAKATSKHEALVLERLSTSSDRQSPLCPLFSTCGACHLMHTSYHSTLVWKGKHVSACFSRIGKIPSDLVVSTQVSRLALASPERVHYRNNSRFHITYGGETVGIGFLAFRSHEVVSQGPGDCKITSEAQEKIRAFTEQYLSERKAWELATSSRPEMLQIRHEIDESQVLVNLYFSSSTLTDAIRSFVGDYRIALNETFPELKGLLVFYGNDYSKSWQAWGLSYYSEDNDGIRYIVEASSFSQVNTLQAAQMRKKILNLAYDASEKAPTHLLDIYGGNGSLSLPFAKAGCKVSVFELHKLAEESGLAQAKENEVESSYRYFLGDATRTVSEHLDLIQDADLIITDPPRQGLTLALMDSLISLGIEKWIYVSCDPSSLARDLKHLLSSGYTLESWEAIDMFPWTGHVETVVLLSKGEVDSKKIRVEYSLEDMDMSEF